MKFIISSLSPNIFIDKEYALIVHELDDEEFQQLAYDGISHIGHEDIAKIVNFAYNKTPVQVRIGDILLMAQKYRGVMKYYCMQVVENPTPLIREEELYIEEELI
jgi:hypothetical protein